MGSVFRGYPNDGADVDKASDAGPHRLISTILFGDPPHPTWITLFMHANTHTAVSGLDTLEIEWLT
jgi:hypothetical protein